MFELKHRPEFLAIHLHLFIFSGLAIEYFKEVNCVTISNTLVLRYF